MLVPPEDAQGYTPQQVDEWRTEYDVTTALRAMGHEVRVLFEELAKRLKSIEPAGEHKFLRSNFVGGIKHLPVRVEAA